MGGYFVISTLPEYHSYVTREYNSYMYVTRWYGFESGFDKNQRGVSCTYYLLPSEVTSPVGLNYVCKVF